jgi:hypothetical protein
MAAGHEHGRPLLDPLGGERSSLEPDDERDGLKGHKARVRRAAPRPAPPALNAACTVSGDRSALAHHLCLFLLVLHSGATRCMRSREQAYARVFFRGTQPPVATQDFSWFTFSAVPDETKQYYRHVSDGAIDWMINWGCIVYVPCSFFTAWLQAQEVRA